MCLPLSPLSRSFSPSANLNPAKMTPTQEKVHTSAALARIFALCDANRAAMLKVSEDQKLSSRRYWWQDNDNDNQTTKTR